MADEVEIVNVGVGWSRKCFCFGMADEVEIVIVGVWW